LVALIGKVLVDNKEETECNKTKQKEAQQQDKRVIGYLTKIQYSNSLIHPSLLPLGVQEASN
jgi:hypothetical protein